MQQVDDPPSLPVGTEVSAKYKGAFCEAKVRKVVPNIKVKVAYKQGLGSGTVSDDAVKGVLRVGATVEVKHPEKRDWVEATITKIQDCSQYTVVFDDGDITTLRRTALCLKSGRHFNESETLDQLPLTHPEHFGNPVIGGRRGRRSRHLQDDSSDEDDDNDTKEVVNEKEEHIGEVVCVESTDSKKKDKDKWFPGLVVAPTAQVTVRIRVKDEYLVRSFKDGRYYTVPKKEAMDFTRELAVKQDGPAVQAALDYLDNKTLPPHWDRDALFGIANSSSEYEGEYDSDSSDDEPREEKDHFVAQLYKYMDDRGTPLNKVPSIANREVDFYRLFRTVQKLGGYNRVTSQNQWKAITMRLGFTPVTVSVTNLVKQAYKKFLQPFVEFDRKLGCSMSMTPRNANRSKGRSLVRANSVASPKPEVKEQKSTTLAEESENTSESSLETTKTKKKGGTIAIAKTKTIPEKYDDKVKEEPESSTKSSKMIKEQPKDEPSNTSSTSIPSGLIKREKGCKKDNNIPEKKGRKKKETDVIAINVEKPSEAPPLPPDFPVEVGDKLKVYYHEKKVTYEAKVIEISVQQGTPLYLVHYTGWNNRYDEWVPRERIAENLTNSKTKRSKGGMSQKKEININLQNESSRSSQSKIDDKTLASSFLSNKTMGASKRGRGRSDSQPPRSTTPSSVASNSSRTKSPATTGRRTTRTQPSSSRRTSNNISDISMQTDSDTDSDEPVKKPSKPPITTSITAASSQNSSSLSKTIPSKTASSSTTTNSSEPDEDDTTIAMIAKGRDYDLNQIRSELKGFKELKSPSPETELSNQMETKKSSNVFDFNMAADDSENEKIFSTATSISKTSASTTTITTIASDFKSSSTEPSSETDSFADDDSQSSDKTTTLENMTEKLQQKIKAEKLAQAKCLERINAGKTVEKIIPPPIKSAGIEKIIRDSLAEKMHESLKAKPYLMEKSIYKAIEKEEKFSKSIPEVKIPPPKSVIPEKKLSQSISTSEKKPTAIESKAILPRQERKPITIEKPSSVASKVVPSSSLSGNTQKESGFSTESIQFKTPTSSSVEAAIKDISKSSTTSQQKIAISSDVYEFKEPEPFEFEGRKLQPSAVLAAEQDKKKKTATTKALEAPTSTTNSVQQSNTKKNKKSPTKDPDKCKQIKTDEKCLEPVAAHTVLSGGPLLTTRSETPFDALRKSPSFNLNINALNEELATTVQETTKVLTDVPERMVPITMPPTQKGMQFISPFIETKTDVSKVFDLKEDVENASREKYDDKLPDGKVELETVKKILLSDPGFDLDPPKIEKPSSIADKVLKALNQQKQEEKIKEETVTSTNNFVSSPLIVLPSAAVQVQKAIQTSGETSKTPLPFTVTEPPKIELPSVLKKEIEFPLKKPILSSPEHKLDILESIAPKNNDLSETIQKLESAIQKGSNVDHFDEDSSDSTDSERRLVIEDDSRSSDGNHHETSNEVSSTATNNTVSSTNLIEIKTKQEENTKEESSSLKLEGIGKHSQVEQSQQHQLPQQQDPSNFTPKYPSIFGIQSTIYSDAALLQDAGVKPIIEFVSPSSIGAKTKTQEHGEKQQQLLEVVSNLEQTQQQRAIPDFQQELQPISNSSCAVVETSTSSLICSSSSSLTVPTIAATTSTASTNVKKEESFCNSQENTNIHTESINLLLCEETIPGSPTPIVTRDPSDTKVNVHPIESDIKPIPMDIECGPSSVPTNAEISSVKMSGKSNNQTPNSSPRDSISQDDSSEDIKKQLEQDSEASSKKRRRTRKHSENESLTKRRRGNNNNNNSSNNLQTNSTKKQNGSDSEDNSDANVSQRSSSSRSSRPCQYNFLVQLDPALSSNQRISILKKKIQDLRKTYNMIKAELVSIDRRRKKLRRRERERRNQQKANS